MKKIEKNVMDFLKKSSEIIGNYYSDNFSCNTSCEFEERDIESPIEKILYCALKVVKELCYIQDGDGVDYEGKTYLDGLGIYPQVKISNYRCDFQVCYGNYKSEVIGNKRKRIYYKNQVFIECDSQEWHERTEVERRYEKTRDRKIQSLGYKIFHYTGKEIICNPFKIACEILSEVTNTELEEMVGVLSNFLDMDNN